MYEGVHTQTHLHVRVRDFTLDAFQAYPEKPRELWLRDFQSQVVLVTSQIVWTLEVSNAFALLEEGNENAMKVRHK